jgi:EAL domain-containing protein (putative c-di-GMP-specific phosphodiesterase class I)
MIIDIGKALGLEVVAEGVESAAQMELLRKMGCRTAQGFWFAEPLDSAGAARLLGQSLMPSTSDRLHPPAQSGG